MGGDVHDFLALLNWVQRSFRDASWEDVAAGYVDTVFDDDGKVGYLLSTEALTEADAQPCQSQLHYTDTRREIIGSGPGVKKETDIPGPLQGDSFRPRHSLFFRGDMGNPAPLRSTAGLIRRSSSGPGASNNT